MESAKLLTGRNVECFRFAAFLARNPKLSVELEKAVDCAPLRCIIRTVGWGWPQSQPVARAIRHLNIDSARQCQLGRRIAPPVIATFELAHVFAGKDSNQTRAAPNHDRSRSHCTTFQDLASSLHSHAAHTAHTPGHRSLVVILRNLRDHCFGCQHQSGY